MIDGVQYKSFAAAAKVLKIAPISVKGRCESPWFPTYTSLHHPKKESPLMIKQLNARKIQVDDKIYKDANEAAAKHSVTYRTVLNRCSSIKFPNWSFIK